MPRNNSTVDTTPLYDEHNAFIANPSVDTARIIFPMHPHCGQEFEILEITRGREPYVIGRLLDGKPCRLALSWTDLEQSDAESPPINTNLAGVNDLLKIACKIREIKQRE